MALTAGTRLGPYEIVAAIGAGGMGEVYRAKDTRLERTVAIKVLPASSAADPEFRARFEREARTISQLNHPHICSLFDVGEQAGVAFLVMEHLEGETLADRLKKGPLPVDQALDLAIEIADALAKAHRIGIIHRDLKPANIMLTKTGSKLLDFGLAKMSVSAASGSIETRLLSGPAPATADPLTARGTILGTFQYMAPEQLEGGETDARSDIWAFGCVLYEMVTGKRTFEAKTQASLIAAILEREPTPITELQPLSPPALGRVVRVCLAKDPDDRFHTAHDLSFQLRWIDEGGSAIGLPAPVVAHGKRRERTTRIALAAASLLLIGSGITAVLYWPRSPEKPVIRFSVSTSEMPNPQDLSVSPDGRFIAFGARPAPDKDVVIWTRPLNSDVAQPLPGTERSAGIFWSPDSRQIIFAAGGKLKKISVDGGAAASLCDVVAFRGATWNREDVVLFSSANALYRVSAAGGTAVRVFPQKNSEATERWPVFLPDGRHFLFQTASDPGSFEIRIGSLDSPDAPRLFASQTMATYAAPGYVLYARDATLLAQPFDAKRLQLTGEAIRLADDVAFNVNSGRAAFAASETGVLVYHSGGLARERNTLTWMDRNGKPLGTIGEPAAYDQVRLSRDEKRVALQRFDPADRNYDICVLDLATQITTRFTFDKTNEVDPTWSPDGRTIAFVSSRNGKMSFFQKPLGGAAETPLWDSPDATKYLSDWSRDGKYILFHTPASRVLYALPLTGDRKPIVVDASPFPKDEAQFSPNGQWIAYNSGESGQTDVFVIGFPSVDNRRQVSKRGGFEAKWRADGNELFYLAPDGKVMSVSIKWNGTTPEFQAPVALFQSPLARLAPAYDQYGVTGDGQRFLFLTRAPEERGVSAAPINVIVNWQPAGAPR